MIVVHDPFRLNVRATARQSLPLDAATKRWHSLRMSKVINLRQARKAKSRADDRVRADENAAKHGRTKSEWARDAEAKTRLDRHLDGHKRDDA